MILKDLGSVCKYDCGMSESIQIFLNRSARADYYRVMKANSRLLARMKRSIEEASKSCTFDHRNEPSIQLEATPETLNEPPPKKAATAAEFMTLNENDSTGTGRSLVGDLAAYAIKWKIGRDACNELFAVLRSHGVHGLPVDCRCAKKTMRKVGDVCSMEGGSYYHFGVRDEVARNVSLLALNGEEIQLQFNIDGLPLYRSSPVDLWPILCRVILADHTCSKVFPVAIFCGKSKPKSVDEFMNQFVQEVLALTVDGLELSGRLFRVTIHSFVCDAPARQYLKKVIAHSGFYSCERCVVRGESGPKFVETRCTLRDDASFRAHLYDYHQKDGSLSPLTQLPLDMIAQFPLDYMHLVLLGVVRRMIRLWLGTTDFKVTAFSSNFRLCAKRNDKKIRDRVTLCSDHITSEFQRRPRQMDENKYFKAHEFRTLLCYTIPFIFRGVFNNDQVYTHFLLLVVSFRIMLGKKPTPNLVRYVRDLLHRFVVQVQQLYGTSHMTYSVHGLLHVVDDYERYGVLDRISAFPFENFMQKLKGYVSRPGQELQQIVKRKHEQSLLEICPNTTNENAELRRKHEGGPLGQFKECPIDAQYEEVIFRCKRYCTKLRDRCICVKDRFGFIVNFVQISDKLYTLVQFFEQVHNFFVYPCESRKVGIVRCACIGESIEAVDLSIAEKCLSFPIPELNEYFVAKLLHEALN